MPIDRTKRSARAGSARPSARTPAMSSYCSRSRSARTTRRRRRRPGPGRSAGSGCRRHRRAGHLGSDAHVKAVGGSRVHEHPVPFAPKVDAIGIRTSRPGGWRTRGDHVPDDPARGGPKDRVDGHVQSRVQCRAHELTTCGGRSRHDGLVERSLANESFASFVGESAPPP